MILLSLCLLVCGMRASDLGPGDIVFTSMNADAPKIFSFVLLTDIQDSTGIYFTDNGWNDTSWHNTSEGTLLWYYIGNLPCGTEIRIHPGPDSSNIGDIVDVDNGFDINASGDAILAYHGTGLNLPTTFLAGVNIDNGGWLTTPVNATDSKLPPELTDGVDAILLNPHQDNWQYSCVRTRGLATSIRQELMDVSNWVFNNVTPYTPDACVKGCSEIEDYVKRPGSGNTLRFDGSDDYVDCGSGSDFQIQEALQPVLLGQMNRPDLLVLQERQDPQHPMTKVNLKMTGPLRPLSL